MNDLRCYVCGKPIGKIFTLASMSEEDVDRVFIIHSACAPRADYLLLVVEVKRQ